MSQNTRESLSVLMDGESDELELRRVLKHCRMMTMPQKHGAAITLPAA